MNIDFTNNIIQAKEKKTLNKPFRAPGGPKKFSVYAMTPSVAPASVLVIIATIPGQKQKPVIGLANNGVPVKKSKGPKSNMSGTVRHYLIMTSCLRLILP